MILFGGRLMIVGPRAINDLAEALVGAQECIETQNRGLEDITALATQGWETAAQHARCLDIVVNKYIELASDEQRADLHAILRENGIGDDLGEAVKP